jgi:hypothetical protein
VKDAELYDISTVTNTSMAGALAAPNRADWRSRRLRVAIP